MRFARVCTVEARSWHGEGKAGFRLTGENGSYENAAHLTSEGKVMERTLAWLGLVLPEQLWFLLKSGVFLGASGVILYFALASSYPAVHDTLHNFRHALAVVPCH
jgi:hypothetical protein